MEYLVGVILGLAVGGLATAAGFDRERSFYPTVMIVIASYYVLFATMGGTGRTIAVEIAVAAPFLILAMVGFKRNLWLVVAMIVGHGVFDSLHHFFIDNPGLPRWWPGFCMTIDVVLGAWLAVRLRFLSNHPSSWTGRIGAPVS